MDVTPPIHVTPDMDVTPTRVIHVRGGGDMDDAEPLTSMSPKKEEEKPLEQPTKKPARGSAARRPATKAEQLPLGDFPTPTPANDAPQNPPGVRDRAFGIARAWIARRNAQGTPVTGRQPEHTLRNLIEPALEAGYSDAEIKTALDDLAESIPSRAQLDRALTARRTGRDSMRTATATPRPSSVRFHTDPDRRTNPFAAGQPPIHPSRRKPGDPQ